MVVLGGVAVSYERGTPIAWEYTGKKGGIEGLDEGEPPRPDHLAYRITSLIRNSTPPRIAIWP